MLDATREDAFGLERSVDEGLISSFPIFLGGFCNYKPSKKLSIRITKNKLAKT